MNTPGKIRGFTLIELLLVVSIIGMLSSIVIASLDNARNKSYDAVRKSDLRQMQVALELYYSDHGTYPAETWCDSSIGSYSDGCFAMIAAAAHQDGWNQSSTFYQQLATPDYMNDLPVDPVNDTVHFYYYEPNNVDEPYPGAERHQGYYLRTRLSDGTPWGICGGIITGVYFFCNE